jgi:hypothetical protein
LSSLVARVAVTGKQAVEVPVGSAQERGYL